MSARRRGGGRRLPGGFAFDDSLARNENPVFTFPSPLSDHRVERLRGERADVLVVVADDRRAMPSRQALVFHADEDEGDFRRAECGDGRVVGADAGDDAVRPDQVVGLARQFLGGLQEADVPMDARARVVEEPRQEIAPGGVRQVDGDDDVTDILSFFGMEKSIA